MAFTFFSFRDTERFTEEATTAPINDIDEYDGQQSKTNSLFANVAEEKRELCIKLKTWIDNFVDDHVTNYDCDITQKDICGKMLDSMSNIAQGRF